jgi:DNA-binding winged helix-turn-helix (wHTH) protein
MLHHRTMPTVERMSDEQRPLFDSSCPVVIGPWSFASRVEIPARCGVLAVPAMSFGPYHVLPSQRLLLEGQRPVRLGSRAFDILVALLERAGGLVSKSELKSLVWPSTNVEDGNLKVQVAALRRTLRDGERGNRYIATVTGRGYWFVAPVVRSTRTNAEVQA